MLRKKSAVLLLVTVVLAGCASAGKELRDNPRITPTSRTGVTSTKGTSVYEKIPMPPATATTAQ